ncbi:MAG: hypothetical protein CMG60_06010 [Candidatus Marinimicrobia bacterium]|nr:hypothetical protein [Candidatus Neomarinimicrobiota bacterium]|tara:strand:+ start:278 stop:742 length:465 start_codon:yes stop_codon:yes gene_type:complete
MKVYLSGPIENAINDGADWRKEITQWLKTRLGHDVFDPVIETRNIIEKYNAAEFRLLKKTNPVQYKKIFKDIIKVDLNAVVHDCDYLIVKWDESVFKGGGTHGEVTIAHWFNKPIFLVNFLSIEDVSSWIFSCADHFVNDFDDLKIKLEEMYSE